ncbi:MAG: RluA family pseudouridine synthase [Candidatus Gracilibacteria bacterium]|jgi:23S rRNA pseudouridine1911/1915/1917 synthase|nr:RluA family pseudouridine synthase [Candidatus Gracilibacteria bacterium]
MKNLKFTVGEEDIGKRVDLFLYEKLDITRSKAKKLIDSQLVKVDMDFCKKAGAVLNKEGLEVEVVMLEESLLQIEPENIALDIIYENNDLIVLSKPAGMVVHFDDAHKRGTMINAVLSHCELSKMDTERPGVVHRLDKGTSGALVMAKHDKAHDYMTTLFAERKIKKTYLALVHGHVKYEKGTIDAPIARCQKDRKKMAVATSNLKGREAITHFEVLKVFPNTTLLKVNIETGRTHQIRVHLSSIGCPIVGDDKYGNSKDDRKLEVVLGKKLPRLFLHAEKLEFVLPNRKNPKCFTAPLPEELFFSIRKDQDYCVKQTFSLTEEKEHNLAFYINEVRRILDHNKKAL